MYSHYHKQLMVVAGLFDETKLPVEVADDFEPMLYADDVPDGFVEAVDKADAWTPLGTFEATMIGEGCFELTGLTPPDTKEQGEAIFYCAFQELVDSGVVWSLQGSFGRVAEQLIEGGFVKPKEENDD